MRYNSAEAEILRAKAIADTLFATRLFFKLNEGRRFNVGEHHKIIAQTLDDVYAGKITRLIINMPPRYSKTEMVVKTFIEKGLAINPQSKYLHISYSGALALDNSECTLNAITSDWYRELFPYVELDAKSRSKGKWKTTAGGGVYATSSSGQVTGFGAGLVDENEDKDTLEEFTTQGSTAGKWGGAIIIDDPIKPLDAMSPVVREKINLQFENTIRSRANSRNTPIIVIMQRLHKRDLAGYLMETEPGKWHVLSLPALSKDEDGNEVALYPFKHTVEELHALRDANPFVFDTQYQQDPHEANDKRWLFAFDESKHCGKTEWKPKLPLFASFDFNRNPITCSLWQIHDGATWGIDAIALQDATTRQLCQEIDRRYPKALLMVTGDAAGSARTTMSIMNNYQEIKHYFMLADSQMQVSRSNPRLAESWMFVNATFEQRRIIIDPDRCRLLIEDFNEVLADEDHKPIKLNRENKAQQADFLDNARYFFHQFNKLLP